MKRKITDYRPGPLWGWRRIILLTLWQGMCVAGAWWGLYVLIGKIGGG